MGAATERSAWTFAAAAATTDRYLDPPVEENYSNHGRTTNALLRVDRDLTSRDRVGFVVRRAQSAFLVPNENVQEVAGQRQDRTSRETSGQFSYQHVVGGNAVTDIRGYARHVDAQLWSNSQSTPIAAGQRRALRELYLKAAVAGHHSIHEWKAGADLIAGTVEERFSYRITDSSVFDNSTPSTFDFADRRPDREPAFFAQDQIRVARWTLNLGVRWDRYSLASSDNAVSPRLAVAWGHPNANLVLRASYDRVFRTPAVENLLLASSPDVDALGDDVLRLPVHPSRGHFFETGATKALGTWGRADVTHFRRYADNAADVLLNTGISFPIAFRRSAITGTELKLVVPAWRAIGASFAYGYMRGESELPITGGLFLDEDAAALLAATDRVPISQDQRHTLRVQLSSQLWKRVWAAAAFACNSGLPVEAEGDLEAARSQYGVRILDRVDFDGGRVRPSSTLDASLGSTIRRDAAQFRVQIDVRNITNRLNVINFAGLFSGTALAPPRSAAGARVRRVLAALVARAANQGWYFRLARN